MVKKGFYFLVDALSILVFIFLYYQLVAKPTYTNLKEKHQNEYVRQMEIKKILLDNLITGFLESGRSVSSRSMIRKEIVKYNEGKISLNELREFTKPKYMDGVKALNNCIYAERIINNTILVESGHKPKYQLIENYMGLNKLESKIHLTDSLFIVEVVSPIYLNTEWLGVDYLIFQDSSTLSRSKDEFTHLELLQVANIEKCKEHSCITDMDGNLLVCFESIVPGYIYRFSKPTDVVFAELYDFEEEQTLVLLLLSVSIFILLLFFQLRTRFIFSTQNKYLQTLVDKKTDELKKNNMTKDKLFSIISHDLKNPFQSLLGITDAIANVPDEFTREEIRNLGRELNKSSKNIYELLDNLLKWSLLQQGKLKQEGEELLLSELTENSLAQVMVKANQKEITIDNKINKDICVYADRTMISSVFLNLLINAIKFTNRKGRIEIDGKIIDDNYAQVSIIDSGVGMSEDVLQKLFKVGEKIGSPGTEGELSTGLGLLLCEEFIKKNNGEIWVESELGVGSKFFFTLPVCKRK
jgi:signal transduction histidine kinase